MSPLVTALFLYAQEHCIRALLADSRAEREQTDAMLDNAMDQLRAMGGEAADYVKRIESGHAELSAIYEEANFAAGVSVGLRLGRL